MNFKKLLKYSSVLMALSLSFYLIAYSCGWSEDECDNYVSFINPSVVETKNASHFFYSPGYFFFQCDIDSDLVQDGNSHQQNLEEWQGYVGKDVNVADIDSFIYGNSYEMLASFYQSIEKNKFMMAPSRFRNNTMTQYFKRTRDREALGYLMYAKQCESLSNIPADSWELPVVDSVQVNRLLKNGRQLVAVAKSDFIKERYLFQLIKTAFYGKRYQQVINMIEVDYPPFQRNYSSVDRRIQGYKAGAFFRMGRRAESAYLFSRLVDDSKDYTWAFSNSVSFVWAHRDQSVEDILRYCKSSQEKAMVYALVALRNQETYSMDLLRKVYELDPNNTYLDVILIRELNKIEHEYVDFRHQVERGYFIYDAWMGDYKMKVSQQDIENWISVENKANENLNRLQQFIVETADQKKVKNPALWYGSAAYLNLIQRKYEMAETQLNKANSLTPSSKLSAQLRIISLLLKWQQQAVITPQFENEILPELKWFEDYSKSHATYRKYYRNLFKSVLPLKYAAQKDTLKMVMCYHKYENEPVYFQDADVENTTSSHFSDLYFSNSGRWMDAYFSQKQLDEMKHFVVKPSSNFNQWLLAKNQYSSEILNELKAVIYFRNFDYVSALNTISVNRQQPKTANPFVAHIRDRQDGYNEDTLTLYSMQQILDTLIVLKRTASNDLTAAFNYACVLYSLSYHGKCHSAWTFHRYYTEVDPYYYDEKSQISAFEKQYYYVEDAMRLFEKVYLNSANASLKQQSLWMLAKCQQKRCNLEKPSYLGWYGEENEQAKAYVRWNITSNPYLAKFYQELKGSSYYDEVYQECSYLQLYARQQK